MIKASPVFDPDTIQELQSIMGKDLSMLVDAFIKDSETKLYALSEAIRMENFESVHLLAHSLCGSCKNLGANQMADICQSLESSDISQRGQWPQMFEALLQAFDAARHAASELTE